MRPIELLVVYLLIGLGVAGALRHRGLPGAAWALPLWPLYLPALLSPVAPETPAPRRFSATLDPLRDALAGWEGLPADLSVEQTLTAAARALEAIDDRRAQIAAARAAARSTSGQTAAPALWAAQQESAARLGILEEAAQAELDAALLAITELTARVHVARFSGGGAEVAAALLSLGAAVDGVAEVRRGIGR